MSKHLHLIEDPSANAYCPRCGWPLHIEDDLDGDGFVTCACGASVDIEAARDRQERK